MILDGPRCSGKSTIGQELVKRLNAGDIVAEYFKKGPPDPVDEASNMGIHLQNWWDRVQDGVDVVVVDRFVATELVMGLATGRTLPERLIPYCQDAAWRASIVHLAINRVLLPPLATLEERMLNRPDDHRWDMDRERIHPLWKFAIRSLVGVTVDQRTTQGDIIDQLLLELIVSEKQT